MFTVNAHLFTQMPLHGDYYIFFNYCQVESYVAHIRGILEERECQTAEYAQENEQLRQELHHIRQQQGELCTDAAR